MIMKDYLELTLEQEYGIQLSQDRATASPKLIQEREREREREKTGTYT